MGNTEKKFLCKLKKRGFIESNTKEYIKLIQTPEFFCKSCGRGAVDAEYLCKPAKMEF